MNTRLKTRLFASTLLVMLAGIGVLSGCSSGGGDTPAAGQPSAVVVPHYAYVASQTDNKVYAYTVDTATGALAANGNVDVTPGLSPIQTAVDPFYRFAYVANNGSHNLSVFSLNTSTGVLTPIGAPVPTGLNPVSVAADPSGRFVYVANQNGFAPGSGTVSAFSLNPATGALTPIVGQPFASGPEPFSVVVHPSGQFLFVSSGPAPAPAAPTNDIRAFHIDQTTGALTPISGPVPAPAIPVDLTLHPSGRFLYVASGVSNSASAFSIDSTTGALTPVNTLLTGGSASRAVAVERTGRFAYVVSVGTNDVSIFNIDATTGALLPVVPPVVSPVPAPGLQARFLAIDPSGGFLYVTYFDSPHVSEFSIDPATGALTYLRDVATGNGSVGISVIGTP
jgi:6-phosphogluconolactonase (cycloisomerase 2 family)